MSFNELVSREVKRTIFDMLRTREECGFCGKRVRFRRMSAHLRIACRPAKPHFVGLRAFLSEP